MLAYGMSSTQFLQKINNKDYDKTKIKSKRNYFRINLSLSQLSIVFSKQIFFYRTMHVRLNELCSLAIHL